MPLSVPTHQNDKNYFPTTKGVTYRPTGKTPPPETLAVSEAEENFKQRSRRLKRQVFRLRRGRTDWNGHIVDEPYPIKPGRHE